MTNFIKTIPFLISSIIGVIVFWLGGLDDFLIALIVLVLVDYVSGVLKAIHNKNISSSVGYKGIVKKVMIFLVVSVSYVVERVIPVQTPIREIVIMFFIANEAISVLENVAETGIPIPQKLKDILLQLRKENGGDNDKK